MPAKSLSPLHPNVQLVPRLSQDRGHSNLGRLSLLSTGDDLIDVPKRLAQDLSHFLFRYVSSQNLSQHTCFQDSGQPTEDLN